MSHLCSMASSNVVRAEQSERFGCSWAVSSQHRRTLMPPCRQTRLLLLPACLAAVFFSGPTLHHLTELQTIPPHEAICLPAVSFVSSGAKLRHGSRESRVQG